MDKKKSASNTGSKNNEKEKKRDSIINVNSRKVSFVNSGEIP